MKKLNLAPLFRAHLSNRTIHSTVFSQPLSKLSFWKTNLKSNILSKFLMTILIAFTFLSGAKAQVYDWAKQMGGSYNDVGNSIATDSSGNVYTVGYFHFTVDFDPEASSNAYLTSAGDADIFISKLDPDGNFLWAKRLGGTGYDLGNSLVLDDLGNIYITGGFSGTVDFDPDAGTAFLTSAGSADIFISKLDTDGHFIWVKQMGGTGAASSGNSIVLDTSKNIYSTGTFTGIVDFDPGAGVTNLTSAGSNDIFVSKLDSDGNFIWAKQLGGTNDDSGHSIAVDAYGSVYTTGSFYGTADFDPGMSTAYLVSAGDNDIFISKLDSDGNYLWAQKMGGPLFGEEGQSIAIDAFGNVYTTGSFWGTVDFDSGVGVANLTSAGMWDVFISKLNSSGDLIWAKQMGGSNFDKAYSLVTDVSGNVYTTGFFNDTADFDPGPGIANLIDLGNPNIFISKLDSSGNFVWAKQMGGTDYYARGNSISVDVAGNIYTTGLFAGTADFDPGQGTAYLNAVLYWDIFISKLASFDCIVLEANIGDSCDDGDSDTENDVITTECVCAGTPLPGTLNGNVDWNAACGARDISVKLYSTGTTTPVITSNTSIDSLGNFTVDSIAPGVYDIWVKVSGALAQVVTGYEIFSGANALAINNLILGDLNGDNIVNIIDLSALNLSYGLNSTQPLFNPLADLNCDGNVNIIDISIFNIGFGMAGDTIDIPVSSRSLSN